MRALSPKKCRECGKDFMGNAPVAYCSDECRLPERQCPSCLKFFRPTKLPKRKAIYCSYRCGVLGRKPASPRGTAYNRQVKYGITPERQARILDQQNHTCKICEEPAAHLDHDVGGVRGFLCAKCNLGLGHFRDRPDLLEGAVKYLRANSSIVAGTLRIIENVKVEMWDSLGGVKDQREFANLVTTVGKTGVGDQLLASPTIGKPTHMAVGTGTNAAAAGDTALQTELDRNALTSKTRSGAVVTMVGDWAAGDATGTISEAGIFDASSSGNIYVRSVFSGIPKASGDSLKITWQLTIA